jgi:hypothetical protein
MMLAAFLGGWLASFVPAADPAPLGAVSNTPLPTVSPNQQLADTIASNLRQSGQLRGYTVDLVVRGNTVEVSGTVANQTQREEVLRIVQGVPGVERVVDRIRPEQTVTPVTALQPIVGQPPFAGGIGGTLPGAIGGALPQPNPNPNPLPQPRELGGTNPGQPPVIPPPLPGPITGEPPLGGPFPGIPGGPGGRPEPMPIFQAPGMGFSDLNPPRMPPYAWPTYAPYNNYSRVAYPDAYPYNAWPFIGPIHPFPKIPLGWRSVKLEWNDGYWWFSRTSTKYDWWRLRFY